MDDSSNVLQVGDRVPQAALRREGSPLDIGTLVGKPFLVVFCELPAFGEGCEQFRRMGVQVVGLAPREAPRVEALSREYQLPFPVVPDPGKFSCTMFGAPDGVGAVLVGPGTRILKKYYRRETPVGLVNETLADVPRLLFPEPTRDVIQQAPLLLIPDVLPPSLCQTLIELWETQGNEDSGFMKQVEGKTVGVYDYQNKIRRDHFLQPGPIEEAVKGCLATRVLPEVQIAFNYVVTRREDFRIACYDATRGGYFRPHRDNTTAGTAHRRFALSLLLNEDYEGGYLRFPEYAPHRYRPGAGGAAVFSCSLLHEATDVTAGRRFVLISFVYGEQEARMRQEYSRQAGGTYKA